MYDSGFERAAERDPNALPRGFGYCNPAFVGQDKMSNGAYLATVHYPEWLPVLQRGFARLDAEFPGWTVSQIKEKFWECRFYALPPEGADTKRFYSICREIEQECDAATVIFALEED